MKDMKFYIYILSFLLLTYFLPNSLEIMTLNL